MPPFRCRRWRHLARPSVTAAPQLLSFASITVGTTSASQNITVTSSSSTALHISNVALGGANAGDRAMTNGCNGLSYARARHASLA
jgi:hypothetical protein